MSQCCDAIEMTQKNVVENPDGTSAATQMSFEETCVMRLYILECRQAESVEACPMKLSLPLTKGLVKVEPSVGAMSSSSSSGARSAGVLPVKEGEALEEAGKKRKVTERMKGEAEEGYRR